MGHENGKICDDFDYICGDEHEMENYTYSLSDAIENNTRDKIYIYGSLNQPMAKNILWIVTTLFFYKRMGERGALFRTKWIWAQVKDIVQSDLGRLF